MAGRRPTRSVKGQLTLELKTAGRGGARPGAGRPAAARAKVLHRARQKIPVSCPVHVTVKVEKGIPKLRNGKFVRAFRQSLAQCSHRSGFRVVHYTIQENHCHFLIEARGRDALANGMKSLNARIAKTVNRVFKRSGSVLYGRYHSHVLKSPLEVRRALAYVLLNHRHHARRPGAPVVDQASSGVWFDRWKGITVDPPDRTREVALPGCWLLKTGWHRRGERIDIAGVPGAAR